MKHTGLTEKSLSLIPGFDKNNYGSQEKKKRLTTDQLDSLERSFQEEIKLDPDRKMKLSSELGLQPRQIAVWFQNRRARWKAKQLEMLYDALKQEFDAVSKEKQKLQEEVCTVSKLSSFSQLFMQFRAQHYAYTIISDFPTFLKVLLIISNYKITHINIYPFLYKNWYHDITIFIISRSKFSLQK